MREPYAAAVAQLNRLRDGRVWPLGAPLSSGATHSASLDAVLDDALDMLSVDEDSDAHSANTSLKNTPGELAKTPPKNDSDASKDAPGGGTLLEQSCPSAVLEVVGLVLKAVSQCATEYYERLATLAEAGLKLS